MTAPAKTHTLELAARLDEYLGNDNEFDDGPGIHAIREAAERLREQHAKIEQLEKNWRSKKPGSTK